MLSKCGKEREREGEAGKKAKTTPDAGGKSVSEKSQATRTSKNPFEKSSSNRQNISFRQNVSLQGACACITVVSDALSTSTTKFNRTECVDNLLIWKGVAKITKAFLK
jgi:hypothetical protein